MRPRFNKSRSRSRWQDQSVKSLGLVYKTHMASSLGLSFVFKYWSRQSVLQRHVDFSVACELSECWLFIDSELFSQCIAGIQIYMKRNQSNIWKPFSLQTGNTINFKSIESFNAEGE